MKNENYEIKEEGDKERDYIEHELSPSGGDPVLRRIRAAVELARTNAPEPDNEAAVVKYIQDTVRPQLDRIYQEAAEERAQAIRD